ncbi:MAG TPA: ParB/RepB/Spo0J family partition protein [Candidatus Dormibacteraeota bacterium]|nr:ParB/RepB/Spo0J family partition protein [Candidatus Dormibacteraeota bacterium]
MATATKLAEAIVQIPIDQVQPATDNPRGPIGDVAELAASIRAVGIVEPLIVTLGEFAGTLPGDAKGYRIVAGHRRLAAAKEAGLKRVPCIVREYSIEDAAVVRLIENLQREDLSPLQEASAFAQLVAMGLAQKTIGERVGRSQAHISKRLALLELPELARKAIDSGGIRLEDALELVKIKDHPKRVKDAISHAGQYGGIAGRVNEHVAELASETKQKATRAQLDKQGVKVAGQAKNRWDQGSFDPKGIRALGGDFYGRVNVKVKDHAKLKCHAAFIGWEGEVTWVCTDPKAHPEAKAKQARESKAEKAERAEYERAEQLRAATTEARKAHWKQLIDGKLTKETIEFVFAIVPFMADSYLEIGDVAELLGMPEDDSDYYDRIYAESAKGGAHAAKVALAYALVYADEDVSGRGGARSEIKHAYFGFMQATGYVLSETERELLAAKDEDDESGSDSDSAPSSEVEKPEALNGEPLEVQRGEIDGEMTTITRHVPNGPPAGEPVSQHACRVCGKREGPWSEMVEIGWLCVDCDSQPAAAPVAEVAGPVDQRAGR